MEEEILSAGIDIGTSTTQLIFSRMIVKDVGGFGKVPQVKVISKQIIYESDIYFTPLRSSQEIDATAIREILRREYEKAGIRPDDLTTGAVIITGESSHKRNAKEVVEAISEMAGSFVTATAGADLESVLAGKGAGAGELSASSGKRVINLDIGGGTTNICLFRNGEVEDTACLDIGGRLVKVEDGKITYIAPKIEWLAKQQDITLAVGDKASLETLRKLAGRMAEILAEAIGLMPASADLEMMKTNHLLDGREKADILTFSGGVAACMGEEQNIFRYGDMGILLAEAILKLPAFGRIRMQTANETMRATVIGAGNYSMNISGSTIEYTRGVFPIKNIPVVKVPLNREEDIERLECNIHRSLRLYRESGYENIQVAFALNGLPCPSFLQIQAIAEKIVKQFEREYETDIIMILIWKQDIGKAVGQALQHFLKGRRKIVCIDGIDCDSGDYIDLGEPIASGTVIPVVVKTLVFHG